MSQAIQASRVRAPSAVAGRVAAQPAAAQPAARDLSDPTYQAFKILHVGFVAAPILAGADKFFHLLVDWDNYLAPAVRGVLGGYAHAFMLAVGVIEIVAGIGVLLRPRIFSYVVAAWLLGIVASLLLFPPGHPWPHYDVALRDFGLCLGALALGRLSERYAKRT